MTTPVNLTYKDDGKPEAVITVTTQTGAKEILIRMTADVHVECPWLPPSRLEGLREEVARVVDEALGEYVIEFGTALVQLHDALRNEAAERDEEVE